MEEKEKSKKVINKSLITTVIVALVVGVAAFWGGMQYSQSRRSAAFRQFADGQGEPQGFRRGNVAIGNRNGNGFRPVNGEIIASDDKSITVKLQDGSSKIIIISDNTQINKAETVSKSDLADGQTVAVFGQENSDGTVTAQSIQLNPEFRNIPQPSGSN